MWTSARTGVEDETSTSETGLHSTCKWDRIERPVIQFVLWCHSAPPFSRINQSRLEKSRKINCLCSLGSGIASCALVDTRTRLDLLWWCYNIFDHKFLLVLLSYFYRINSIRIEEKFLFNSNRVNPIEIAQQNEQEFMVKDIIAHRGDHHRRSSMEFLVRVSTRAQDAIPELMFTICDPLKGRRLWTWVLIEVNLQWSIWTASVL